MILILGRTWCPLAMALAAAACFATASRAQEGQGRYASLTVIGGLGTLQLGGGAGEVWRRVGRPSGGPDMGLLFGYGSHGLRGEIGIAQGDASIGDYMAQTTSMSIGMTQSLFTHSNGVWRAIAGVAYIRRGIYTAAVPWEAFRFRPGEADVIPGGRIFDLWQEPSFTNSVRLETRATKQFRRRTALVFAAGVDVGQLQGTTGSGALPALQRNGTSRSLFGRFGVTLRR